MPLVLRTKGRPAAQGSVLSGPITTLASTSPAWRCPPSRELSPCCGRFTLGSPAILVQVGHDLEEFPGKPRTPSQPLAMGLRGRVETPSALRSENPEASVFAVRHHPHR